MSAATSRRGSFVVHLSCPRCGDTHDHRVPQNLCSCGSPLLVEYDLERVASAATPRDIAARAAGMWRYRELLPVEDPEAVPALGEGWTPLLPLTRLGDRLGLRDLWLKDESPNPTGTFKARGAACGIARARELRIEEVALPTAGNAGGAWACYGAAAGIRVHVAMPEDASPINRLECEAYGADVLVAPGLISDADRALAERGGDAWFDVGTLREPYRIEGKKTMGLEIAEQLGWRAPDAIVYPAGGGVGAIGIWRAFLQLRDLGWVEGEPPRIVLVQAAGCAPMVRAFEEGREESEPWEGAATVASGLRVPKALGDFLALRAVRETGGTAVAVPDGDIVDMVGTVAREAGVLLAPEAAAAVAGAAALRQRGDLAERDRVVVVGTGTGLKYPEVLERLG